MARTSTVKGKQDAAKLIVEKPAEKLVQRVELTQEMIARRAFEIWCGKGRPWGGEAENWAQAERELATELGFAPTKRSSRADARS